MNPPRQVQKNGKTQWLVDLRELGGGRKFRDTETEARKLQADAIAERDTFGKIAFELPRETRVQYLAAERKLLDVGATIDDAVAWYLKTHKSSLRKPIGEAVKECISAKQASGNRKRACQQLKYTLNSLAASVGLETPCSDVTLAQVEAWLANPDWAMRTRKGRLIDARTFFAFAKHRKWIAVDPSEGVEPIKYDEGRPGILTLDQIRRLLEATRKHRPGFLPFIVLGIFAGVRPEELKQLEWKWLNLDAGYCEIPTHIAKRVRGGGSRQRRLIQLQPNAIAWLKLGGELPPSGWQDRWDVVRKAAGFSVSVKRKGKRAKSKGEPWPKNAMRHSFCSYCLPVFGELKESEWAGHSPEMAISRYRELVPLSAATAFWQILP